jgi:hypothetical protein
MVTIGLGHYTGHVRLYAQDDFTRGLLLPRRRVTYKAVVTTGAKDQAGTALDQKPSVAGSQQMVWYFTIRT